MRGPRRTRSSWYRSIVAGLAVLAIALGQLAPALAHAVRVAPIGGGLEICSVHGGGGPVDRDGAPSLPATPDDHAGGHGSCCLLHAPELAPPRPVALEGATAATLSIWWPHRFLSAARTPHAWSTTQPRAPPPPPG